MLSEHGGDGNGCDREMMVRHTVEKRVKQYLSSKQAHMRVLQAPYDVLCSVLFRIICDM
jgi:hypothetical protein